ncbi:hypothetical protein EDD15DRAFT_2259946 [Pisolithus albus]|nr:hypothetical protein EDD15DRAFT_2259946 [Pisolithus albus]
MFPAYYRQLARAAFAEALVDDSIHTLACYRSTFQLAKLFGLKKGKDNWEAVKEKRASLDYAQLCKMCMQPSGIQCILIDDGLSGDRELAEGYKWHDQYTFSPTRRIVRIEVEAQNILLYLSRCFIPSEADSSTASNLLRVVTVNFEERIVTCANDDDVVGFKSIACYRTGLDILPSGADEDVEKSLLEAWTEYDTTDKFRLKHKALNDYLVRIVLRVAGQYKKPGLGDNDITLTKSSPAHMQPLIKAFPDTTFVLLHSGYPYSRESGYLTAVYKNRAVVKQVLELSPTNKLLWSTDGRWWPESFYLASIQSRQVLYDVIAENFITIITLMLPTRSLQIASAGKS